MALKSRGKLDNPDVVELLRQIPILHGLEEKDLTTLRNAATEVTFAENQMIIKDGSFLADLYMILRGRVEVRKKRTVIAKLGKGQFFGEMAFLNDSPTGRSADIVAIEETKCLDIRGPVWYAFLRKNPDIAIEVIRTLAERLRNTDWSPSELQNPPTSAPET